jgi:transposase
VSQSLLYHAFGVREGYDYVRTEYHQGTVEFHPTVTPRLMVCPHCQGRGIIRKGKRFRRIQTVPIGLKLVFLVVEVPRCQCRQCGQVFEVDPPLPRPMSTTPND